MNFADVRRRLPRPILSAAVACVALPGIACADVFAVTKSADTTIDGRALVLDDTVDAYGIGVNGNSFENNAITTYNGWQYTAYWVRTGTTATSNYVAVARRQTGTSTWQVANLTASTFTNGLNGTKPSDAHNVVSLGIDETDGTLHLAYDMHGHTLKYRVSNTGVATNPSAITAANWSQSLFQTQRNWLTSSSTPVSTVTYPHFMRQNNGALQLTYRTGASGAGSNWMADYNGTTGTWGNVHQYDDGFTGSYVGTVTNGDPNRNSYINGATYGPTGRLYQSFTWREGATGAANHDIAFVYSDDKGNTWKNNAGAVVGNAASGQTWNLNTPGLTVVPLDESQSLMNQQTQAVSGHTAADERFHTLMWHRDTAKANTGGVYSPTESSYFHYWRDTDGYFHRSKLPGQVGSRPKLFFDANDNAFAIYQLGAFSSQGLYINSGDLVIAAATKASNWNDWKIIKTETTPTGFVSEAQADARGFALTGTLSVEMQNSPTVFTSAQATAMRALDYTFAITPATNSTAAASGSWLNTSTWGGVAPTGNANAIINGGRSVSLGGASAGVDNAVVIGSGGTSGALDVGPGAILNVGGSLIVGRDGGAGGTYTQTGGTATAWRMAVGDYYDETTGGGPSTATVAGGTLTVGELQIAMGQGSSASQFSTSGTGSVVVNGEVILGDRGNSATMAVSGGTMTVAGDIHEGLGGSANSVVSVTGGTLDMTGNSIFADNVVLSSGRIQNVKSINNAAITKTGSGTIAFAGGNTFTQPVTISAGAVRAESNAALGTTAGNTVVTGGSDTGQLQLSGGITVAEPIVLGGRQGAAADAPHVNNVAGTNTLTGTINTTSGGNQYNVNSDSGKLIVSGNFVNNGTGGAADVRTLKLTGAGDGEWQSNINDAAGNAAVTAVTKTGAGTWTLAGANTYTGATTINGGTLRLGQVAAAAAVATYSFDSVSGSTVTNTGTGGTAMNGTLANGATIVAGGQTGNAVSVSGGGSVDISNPIADLGPTAAWTVSAWSGLPRPAGRS